MNTRHVEVLLDTGAGGPEIKIRNARVEDVRRIQVLYAEVYGQNYPMPLIYDRSQTHKAITSDSYFWLVGEHNGRIIGSLLYAIDKEQRLAKAIGAVVSNLYRKHNLANTLMKIILDKITKETKAVDMIYATTRTVTTAPQHMTENLNFVPLGIFPNAHKVFERETHCLAGYFVPEAWKKRKGRLVILEELEPLYNMVRKNLHAVDLELGAAKIIRAGNKKAGNPLPKKLQPSLIRFEVIHADNFVRERYRQLGNAGVFTNHRVPFHEPNLLLMSLDQKTEVYVHYGDQDKYCVILGGRSAEPNFSHILNSAAEALAQLDVSYIEILVDAYSPDLQRHALDARFMPSAYFPAMTSVGNKRYDHIVFSRSFDMLDFRNVRIIPEYKGFLQEYLKVWHKFYIESAFEGN